ncbi:hypothetical protein [Streptomyces sp. NRRL B-1381]|uniref:hypothetical protein n=1 Tax=Streptomyces sp. NRRL B-1381 TaxID=1463829 RepID=UPI0004C1C21D|nr:hypothetical protein [Streptomyces sp. NRRL B-1381]
MSLAMWERQVRTLMPILRAMSSSTWPAARRRAMLRWTAVTGASVVGRGSSYGVARAQSTSYVWTR